MRVRPVVLGVGRKGSNAVSIVLRPDGSTLVIAAYYSDLSGEAISIVYDVIERLITEVCAENSSFSVGSDR